VATLQIFGFILLVQFQALHLQFPSGNTLALIKDNQEDLIETGQETELRKSHKDKNTNNGRREHQTNSPDSLHWQLMPQPNG
tara:strand:- start:338 stop:583 length:246 start_codon:yes stop_codon:yes gene_type:complete